jgi:hypothetical protein
MNEENAYDHYLMYQYHYSGDFETRLFRCIEQADEDNLGRLALGFPGEVEAYKVWSRQGKAEFYKHCSPKLLRGLRKRGVVL